MIKAMIFDFGHTIMDEIRYREEPLRSRPVRMMPGVMETLTQITLSKGSFLPWSRA